MAKDEHEHPDGPVVEVLYLNTNAEEKFHVSWEQTVAAVWEEAYDKLKEARREIDTFECQEGSSLMGYLNLTMAQLRHQHICQNRKFQIKSETGGA